MRARLWFRGKEFVKRHAAVLAVLWVTFVGAAGLAGLQWEADNRADAVAAEAEARATDLANAAAERREQICAESRNLRALVSELIDTAVTPGGSVRFDEVPSFSAMPASVQEFLRDYAAAQAGGESGPDLAERLRQFQADRLGELPEFCQPGGDQ